MSKFNEFDHYVTPFAESEQGDFWYDFAADYARKLIKQFDRDDYTQLQKAMQDKSDEWIIRMCETVDFGQQTQVMSILLSLLCHENQSVVLASLEGIRSIVQNGLDVTDYITKIEDAISRISSTVGPVWRIALADLQRLLRNCFKTRSTSIKDQ